MFGLLKSNPHKQIRKEIQLKLKQAMKFQRSGKLREYADLVAEIENLEYQLQDM